MAFLSANLFVPNKTLIPSKPHSINPPRNPRFLPTSTAPPLPNPYSRKRIAASASSSAAATTAADLLLQEKKSPASLPEWGEFARRVSGEWDGFGAEFTVEGNPIELPEAVVPEAFREWDVRVFDWQTQCPTLAVETGDPLLSYKLIKLLPTVGCEADAATRHSVEERIAGGEEDTVSAFGYHPSGRYVAVWPVEGHGEQRLMEVEHCLVDPGNQEARVRVIQVAGVDEGVMRLERIMVFSEQWYGPFRNGEQLGGCSIRESGFASSGAVKESEVVGVWQGASIAVAGFGSEQTMNCGKKQKLIENELRNLVKAYGFEQYEGIFRELLADRVQMSVRDQVGLVLLPKQLWCSLKEKDGETWAEVGWLVDRGCAMTSRCVFLKDGRLKEMAIGKETAVLEGM